MGYRRPAGRSRIGATRFRYWLHSPDGTTSCGAGRGRGSAAGSQTVTTRLFVSYNETMQANTAVLAASVVALAAGLTSCGVSKKAATVVSTAAESRPRRIVFGIGGGNLIPFRITLEPDGRVRHSGPMRPRRHHLSRAEVVSLFRLVRVDLRDGLTSRQCSGTNPDVGSRFIRGLGRTITVHGSCEPRFTRLWRMLAQAVGLSG